MCFIDLPDVRLEDQAPVRCCADAADLERVNEDGSHERRSEPGERQPWVCSEVSCSIPLHIRISASLNYV